MELELLKYITQSQIDCIISKIKERCNKFRDFDDLFYEPYSKMRKKHSLTLAVISAFSPRDLDIKGLSCEDVNYGINDKMSQPELRSKNAIFHIYSDSADLKNKLIKSRCEEYNMNDETPIFFAMQFSVNGNGYLKELYVHYFDNKAQVVKTEIVWKNNIEMRKSA